MFILDVLHIPEVCNLQVLLIILILKSRFYYIKNIYIYKNVDVTWFLKSCVAEAILRKSALKFSLYAE